MVHRSSSVGIAAASATLALFAAQPSQAQEHDHQHAHGDPSAERLGRVVFPVSCNAEAQQRFERAMALLHSFWWSEAQKAFDGVLEADPGCAMAYWGKAVTYRGNPFGPPAADAPAAGLVAARRAAALNPPTERERDFIVAITELWKDHQTVDLRTRSLAYEAAMQRVHERHPDDPEAAIYYAMALTVNAPATDLSFERQRRAGAILEPLFERYPDHPGLAHYLIHTYDSPQLAHLGVEAARQYHEIAPSVPHAQHMPSHVFTRLGMWEESIAANSASAASARAYEEAQGLEAATMDRVHAWDYLVYAYLQRGQDGKARRVLEEAQGVGEAVSHIAVEYALAAIPARFALERGDWADAAQLRVRPAPGFRAAEAITHFARGIGAVRSGNPAAAAAEIEALAAVRDALDQPNQPYNWAQLVEAQRLAVAAWVAHRGGNAEEALKLAARAAELEEEIEKHPVTPGPILSARELEGDLLLELGQPAEARDAYEKALVREPNRARPLFGAARAAELAGDREAAREHYSEFMKLMEEADAERPELRTARTFLAAR
jgi:tetratricopeptide (TPR) repeat protein